MGRFMKDIVIIGAGGLGRRLRSLLKILTRIKVGTLGYIDETPKSKERLLITILFWAISPGLKNSNKKLCIVCAVGNPLIDTTYKRGIDYTDLQT